MPCYFFGLLCCVFAMAKAKAKVGDGRRVRRLVWALFLFRARSEKRSRGTFPPGWTSRLHWGVTLTATSLPGEKLLLCIIVSFSEILVALSCT